MARSWGRHLTYGGGILFFMIAFVVTMYYGICAETSVCSGYSDKDTDGVRRTGRGAWRFVIAGVIAVTMVTIVVWYVKRDGSDDDINTVTVGGAASVVDVDAPRARSGRECGGGGGSGAPRM